MYLSILLVLEDGPSSWKEKKIIFNRKYILVYVRQWIIVELQMSFFNYELAKTLYATSIGLSHMQTFTVM